MLCTVTAKDTQAGEQEVLTPKKLTTNPLSPCLPHCHKLFCLRFLPCWLTPDYLHPSLPQGCYSPTQFLQRGSCKPHGLKGQNSLGLVVEWAIGLVAGVPISHI